MILKVDGDINRYYVQTLSMIYFPGASFPDDELPGPGIPELDVKLVQTDNGFCADAKVTLDGKCATAVKARQLSDSFDADRCRKLVVGEAVTSALGELMEYKPSWGLLMGVRPSKVATELIKSGMSKTRTKRTLISEYLIFPKKAELATDVAINEHRIIGTPGIADCSLYISIPFCPSRCAYCSFVSYTSKKLLSLIPDYVDRLDKDIRRVIKEAKALGLHFKTVYFGGGTPTVLEPDQIVRLLSAVREELGDSGIEEFTFESGRPDTFTSEKMKALRDYGIDRISVNPQTLCTDVLEGIGRSHTVEDFYRAFGMAREAGIKSINTDIIAGLPGDDFTKFSKSVDGIIALRPENVTVHTFCIKRSSQFKQEGNFYSMRGGDAGKCVDYSQIRLQSSGYIPYYMYRQKNTVGNFENVGFALPGEEGRYNIYMMEEVHSVLAVGAGAVTKFVHLAQNNGDKPVIKRYFNPKYPFEYLREENCDELISSMKDFYGSYPANNAND